jgi:iron complex outermembrane receptor protein
MIYADDSVNALEEIVVTARKRSESIQDVPLAVTAIQKELKEASIRRIDDIQAFAPNIYINRTPGIASGAAITIRGVSSSEVDKSFEPAIGVVMDGMYLGTASGVLLQNFDIERIEVLRGPQGILFGKNTTGGVLNIIRTPVTMEYGTKFQLTSGDNNRQDIKAVIQLPLIEDKLGIKLFAADIEHDGHIYNSTRKENVGGDDIRNYGFTTLWEPTDNFSLKLHHEIMVDKSIQGAYTNRNVVGELACTITLIGFDPANGCEKDANDGPDVTESEGTNFSDNEYESTIVTSNLNTDDFLYTYIYAARDMDEQNMQDFDGSPAHLLRMNYYNDWEQTSHEFRITSQFSETFEFVAGYYDWNVEYEQFWDVFDLFYQLSRLIGWQGGGWGSDVASSNGQNQTTDSQAIYFSGDWHVNDLLTLTAGFRWTEEEKDFLGGNAGTPYYPLRGDPRPPLVTPVPYYGKWTETTPKVGFRYQPNDDMMVFGSYSEGFKSGGFFGRQANFNIYPGYDPEYVKNFELGMKSTWLEGRMIFNASAFIAKYEDKQESILIPVDLSNVATVVRNAAALDMNGIELELMYQITDAWDVMTNYGHMSSEYDNYLADLNGDNIITDNAGLTPRNTPEATFGLTTSYTVPVGNGDIKTRLSYRFRDKMESNSSNVAEGTLDSIDNLNATVTYSFDNYSISVFGQNITDQREQRWSTIGGLTSRGWWNEGARYGIEFSAEF